MCARARGGECAVRRGAAGGAQLYAVVQLIGPKHRPHAQALPTSNAPFTDATRAVRNGEAAEIAALPERRIESWPAQSTRVFGPSVGVPLSKFVWDFGPIDLAWSESTVLGLFTTQTD